MLDMAILGLLEERDLHGYEIRRQLRDNLGILANVSFGSIYPALTRLEKAGAVVATEARSAPTRPGRRRTRGPPDRLAQRRTGRPAGPPPRRLPLPPGQEGLPDHRQGPAALRPAPGRRGLARRRPQLRSPARLRPASRPPGPAGPAGAPPGPAGPASRRGRGTNVELDVYARSVVQHTADSVAQDITWLDRLIASERAAVPQSAAPQSNDTPYPNRFRPNSPMKETSDEQSHPPRNRRSRQLRLLADPGDHVLPRRPEGRHRPRPHARRARRLPRP